MSDEAAKNVSKYKAAFTNADSKKDFVKTTPFKFIPGYSSEKLAALGLKTSSSKK